MPARATPSARARAAFGGALLALVLVAVPHPLGRAAAEKPKPLPPGRVGEPLAPIGALSPHGAVASDAHEASRAAVAILEAGGNAIDAAVAGAFALGAAQPGGSGLGGQTWIVFRSAGGEEVAFLSPLRAPRRIDLARARTARRGQVMTGPLAAIAPASVATLARAHTRFGTKPWHELVAPAAAIAEAGYLVNEAERAFLLQYRDRLEASPALRPIYLTGECDAEALAVPVPVGHRVVFPGLARTLRRLAEAGPDDFYRGGIAAEIVADLERHDAFLRADDLARVPASIAETRPLRGTYRGLDVLTLPAPGGGSLVLRALHVLQAFPSGLLGSQPWARTQAIVEAVRIAYAHEQGRGLGEEVPDGPDRSCWLDPEWGFEQASRVRLGRALPPERLPQGGRATGFSDRDTTHLSVVDREGNAVSLTQSLGRTWGSMHVTPGLGFPYNAFLEGFDVDHEGSVVFLRPNAPVRTAVAPTILLRDGRPALVLGAAGSTRITSAVVNAVVGYVDEGLGVAAAVAAPRASWSEGRNNRGPRVELAPPLELSDVDLLRAVGYGDLEAYAPEIETTNFGALNAVGWNEKEKAWEAGAEPRRRAAAAAPSRAQAGAPTGNGARR